MRVLLLLFPALVLSGCQLIYKLPTRQGNVIEQKQLDKLQAGMSSEQVRFLLGTPVANSPVTPDRWDYLGYYKNPRGKVFKRTVSLFFAEGKLVRMEGVEAPDDDNGIDQEAGRDEARTKKAESDRKSDSADTGIVITPE